MLPDHMELLTASTIRADALLLCKHHTGPRGGTNATKSKTYPAVFNMLKTM